MCLTYNVSGCQLSLTGWHDWQTYALYLFSTHFGDDYADALSDLNYALDDWKVLPQINNDGLCYFINWQGEETTFPKDDASILESQLQEIGAAAYTVWMQVNDEDKDIVSEPEETTNKDD